MRMLTAMTRLVALSEMTLVVGACATHTGPAPVGEASAPRVGWVIMQGPADNPDEEFVCQSNPRNDCTIPASTPDRKVFTDVFLYFHPIGTPIRYDGAAEISFLNATHRVPLAITVDAKNVARNSVVGIVSEKPGTYDLTFSATATTSAGPVQIADRVPVKVK